jgi:hypothetical protein
MYEKQFQEVHQLLKDHGCKSTFSFEKEYECSPVLGGMFFYRTDKEMDSDRIQKEWDEKVDARLDVSLPTKKSFSERDKIRFDIEWSEKAHLYSMYVSLPTSARSVSLSHGRYKNQKELIADVGKWLAKAGCRKAKKNDIQKPNVKEGALAPSQLSLF